MQVRKLINNKLTLDQVKQIKFEEKGTYREISEKYNVHLQTIAKIKTSVNWAWVKK